MGRCDRNHLQLNTGRDGSEPLTQEETTNTCFLKEGGGGDDDAYKFLGLLNNKLGSSKNAEAFYRKGQSSLFFLRRLRSFNVDARLLPMFYHSVVASVIFSAAVCLGGTGRCGGSD